VKRTTPLLVSLLVLLLAGAAGCTSTSSGSPRPADSATTPTGEPSRPQEIRLDDVDPCTLLPEADYSDYYLDEPGEPRQNDLGSEQCVWFGDVGYLGVSLVTFEGVEAQDDRNGQMSPTDPIHDFPAYTLTLPGDENACFVLVDVADGQNLNVQAGLDSSRNGIPPVCDFAHQFASSVMSTLVKS
jgi:hypothetical protein